MVDTQTYTIDGPDDETESVELPATLIELLREGDETGSEVVGDVVVQAFAQQAHVRVHHAEGEPSEALEEAESEMMDRFEERFGVTYAEATGHSH